MPRLAERLRAVREELYVKLAYFSEVLVEIRGREASLGLEVENEEVASDFKQNTTKLHKMLDGMGYKFTYLSAVVKNSATTVETALLKLVNGERSGGIDVVI